MKYPYSVKRNGKYYRPNQEIPDEFVETVETPVETEEVVENSVETVEAAKKSSPKRAKKD